MSHFTSPWNKFRKVLYCTHPLVLLALIGAIFRENNEITCITNGRGIYRRILLEVRGRISGEMCYRYFKMSLLYSKLMLFEDGLLIFMHRTSRILSFCFVLSLCNMEVFFRFFSVFGKIAPARVKSICGRIDCLSEFIPSRSQMTREDFSGSKIELADTKFCSI